MLNWFLSTSILIAVILLVRHVLRDKLDPRLTYALWLLVALRICIPVSLFTAPVSVSGLAEDSGLTQAVEEVRYTTEHETTYSASTGSYNDDTSVLEETDWFQRADWFGYRGVTDVHIVDKQEVTAAEAGGNPASEGSFARLELEITRDRFFFLRVIWYAGMAVMALCFVFTNLRFRLQLHRSALPAGVDAPLPVLVMPSLVSPCLCGLFRPAIYVTPDCLTDETRLCHVLTHELTHYRHKDHWWAVVRCACLVVQWFNPLVWLAAWLSRQDCELACDASVIKRLGESQRLSYGKTLVDMIAATRTPGALLQTATTMTGGKKSIAQRIRLIVKQPKMTAVTLVAVLLVAAVTAACTFGGAKEETPSPEETFDTPAASDSPVVPSTEVPDEKPPAEPEPSVSLPADLSAAELAQSVYAAIVGDYDARDFYVEMAGAEGSHSTTLHITSANDPLVDYVGRCLPSFAWDYTGDEGSCAGNALTLTSADGETWLRCWEDSYRVRLHVNGQDYFLTAARPQAYAEDMPLYSRMLLITEDAPWGEDAPDPADLAQSVYAAIVGDYASRDFYVEIYDNTDGSGGTTTRIHMTSENDWNLPDNVNDFDWAYAEPDLCATPVTITLTSADGKTTLSCYDGCDRVTVHVNGQNYLLSGRARGWEGANALLITRLLRAAEDVLLDQAYSIVIDGSITDYAAVVEEYARQFAANLNALPDWVSAKPEDVVYRTSGVSQAYFGEGTENFCGSFGLYFSPEMGMSDWQAGPGMDEETEGEYTGWWKWGIGADFSRNESGVWYCSSIYSGGEFLEFPTPLSDATMEELVYYFYHTSGNTHSYRIPYYICLQPVSSLNELNRLLGETDVPHELCAALGAFLREHGNYDDIQLTYGMLSSGLDAQFRPWLEEGYTGTPE